MSEIKEQPNRARQSVKVAQPPATIMVHIRMEDGVTLPPQFVPLTEYKTLGAIAGSAVFTYKIRTSTPEPPDA